MRGRTIQTTLAVVALLATTTGCRSFTANVPGVLDLRSDGMQASPATDKVPAGDHTREAVGAILTGSGVQAEGAKITVEDRHWWVLGLFGVFNTSMKEEMQAAIGKNALRNVYVGEQQSGTDVGLLFGVTAASIVINAIPVLGSLSSLALSLINGPMTGTFSGERVTATGGGAAVPGDMPTPPPTEPAPVPDAATPAPASPGGAP